MARKKLKRGGLTKGKSHAKGGIPMTVKSTKQKVELEGGEGVINKYVMADKEKYSFEGRKMTACEIASKLNQETGNGVKFECEETKTTDMTPTDSNTGFAKGGVILKDEFYIMNEDASKKLVESLPPVYTYNLEYNNSIAPSGAIPKYDKLIYEDIPKIKRSTYDGKDLGIMISVSHGVRWEFAKDYSQIKKFPTVKLEVNGKTYSVAKWKESRYGNLRSPLLAYAWYAPFADNFLKGIASPLYVVKIEGIYGSIRWNIVDAWSGNVGGVENMVLGDNWNESQKQTAIKYVFQNMGRVVLYEAIKQDPKIKEILGGLNFGDDVIGSYDAFKGRNVINYSRYLRGIAVSKGLDQIHGNEQELILNATPILNPAVADNHELPVDTYIELSDKLVTYIMGKEFAKIAIDIYNKATIDSINQKYSGVLSPAFQLGTSKTVSKGKKKGGKFNRDEAFADAGQQKDIATLRNLMEVFADAPNALKEMNGAIRRLEQEAELEVNLEGKKNFNLKKSFESYFDIVGRAYTGKRGKRTNALAPDGERSDLTTKQYDIARGSNFKQWFGDWEKAYETKNYNGVSKVVSEDGEPKVVFHGTMPKTEFTKFKFDKFPVMYFSEDEHYAEFFATKTAPSNPKVMFEFFLNIRNPLNMVEFGVDKMTVRDLAWLLYEKYGIDLDISKCPDGALDARQPFWAIVRNYGKLGLNNLIPTLRKYGYDGIKYIENNPQWKHNGKEAVTLAWMMFDANDAKLADGRNTTFSSFREDFRFNQGGDVTE